MKSVGMVVLLLGCSSFAWAGAATVVPEISPATGVGAITLLSGVLLVIRSRRKR